MPNVEPLSKEALIRLYVSMLRIRRAEEAIAERYPKEEMRCPTHLYIGQEGIAAGVCEVLRPQDAVFSNHRGHGHYLAKGGDLAAIIAELYGKAAGCAGGWGGSMHLVDKQAGFWGAAPIVGGTVPLAVGAAWAARYQGSGAIAVAFFGDACFEEGVMHECLNFAALKRIPVLFVCENNGLSVFTKLEERQPPRAIHGVAKAHGWGVWVGDGNDVCQVFQLASRAAEAARGGAGPQFLEFSTYRWLEHCGPNDDNHLGYRSAEETEEGRRKCPLRRLRFKMEAEKIIDAKGLEKIETDVKREIEEAFDRAAKAPVPKLSELQRSVYAD